MWQSIPLQAAILVVLVAANYHEPISQTVKVEKDDKYETIQIYATLAPALLKDAPTQHKVEFKATRLSGTAQFDYLIDMLQWHLSDQKGSTGFTQSLMQDTMNWSASEKETAWRAATGSRSIRQQSVRRDPHARPTPRNKRCAPLFPTYTRRLPYVNLV